MQRQIKFRYWNDVSKMMVHDPVVPTMKKEEWTLDQYFGDRGWVWQQFTGLKDKNGKEIYEGGIVLNAGVPEIVEWIEGQAEPFSFLNYWDCPEAWEIIGNIYENPDLLKTN